MSEYQDTVTKPQLILNPKQSIAWKYLNSPKYADIRDIGYGGAAGGGKSYLGAAWLIRMATKHPNTRWFAGRKRITDLTSTVTKKFFEVLRDLGYEQDVDFEFNIKNKLFKFIDSGSEIELLGLAFDPSDPECRWLGGYEYTGGWVDESNEVDSRVLDVLINTRTGRVGNSKKVNGKSVTVIPVKVLQTFNPDQNHVYTRFWLPYKNKLQKVTRFIRAFVYDNYDQDHPYVKGLEAMEEGVRKDRLLRGSFDYNSSERAMFDSEAVRWMTENKPTSQYNLKYLVVDVSASDKDEDKTLAGVFDVQPLEDGWRYDCSKIEDISHTTIEELIDKTLYIAGINGIIVDNIIVDGNGVGDSLVKSRRMKGCIPYIAHSSAIKSVTEGVVKMKKGKNFMGSQMTAVAHRLRDQCVHRLAEKVNRHHVTVSMDNPEYKDMLKQEVLLYEDLSLGTDNPVTVTRKKEIRTAIGRSPDVSDLFQMVMIVELMDKHLSRARPKRERKFIKLKKKKTTYV